MVEEKRLFGFQRGQAAVGGTSSCAGWLQGGGFGALDHGPLAELVWKLFRRGMLGLKALHSSDLTCCETAHGFIQDVGRTWSELSGRIY